MEFLNLQPTYGIPSTRERIIYHRTSCKEEVRTKSLSHFIAVRRMQGYGTTTRDRCPNASGDSKGVIGDKLCRNGVFCSTLLENAKVKSKKANVRVGSLQYSFHTRSFCVSSNKDFVNWCL